MKNIHILITTDIHGSLFPHYYHNNEIAPYSLSRISTIIKKFRENGEVILIDNGDILQGSPFSAYSAENNISPTPLAMALNFLQYNYINLGNHDFNYGEEYLFNYLNNSKALCICGNAIYKEKAIGQSKIYETKGIKIAFIGAVTQYIPNWEQPQNIKHFTFIDAFDYVQAEVNRLKDEVDYAVVVYHGGLERDLDNNIPTEVLTGENLGSKMINEIAEIDVLVTGHQHRSIAYNNEKIIVLQANYNGNELMDIEIDVDKKEIKGSLIDVKGFEVDQTFLDPFLDLEVSVQKHLDQPLGRLAQGSLWVDNPLEARLNKHPLASFSNQILFSLAEDAQLAVSALFNTVPGFNEFVSLRDLASNYIYPNSFAVVKMSGKNVKAMLEKSAEFFALDNDDIIINPEFIKPKLQLYNYDMVDGIDYTIKVSNSKGERIISCLYQGEEIVDDEYFKVIMNNYRATGGGDFSMIKESELLYEIPIDMISAVIDYFKQHPIVNINHKENIKVIK